MIDDGGAAETLDDASLARALVEAEPGPAAMAMLRGLDLSGLEVGALIEVARAWQRQAAWVAAQSRSALAALNDAPAEMEPAFAGAAGRALAEASTHEAMQARVAELPAAQAEAAAFAEAEWRCDEVAAVLRWSPVSASARLSAASRLVNELPATLALLEVGEISDQHAGALLDIIDDLAPEQARAVEARVLANAPGQTVAEFRRCARRAALRVDPDLAAARRARAITERGVRLAPRPDGMAALIATMAVEDAHTVWLALDAAARKAAAQADAASRAGNAGIEQARGDAPTGIDAWRADALLAWAQHALADPDLPRRQGRRVELQVVVDLPTLLGLADNPADLAGYGPIPAEAARELAADATWRRLVTDPVTGALLDYGGAIYRPPQPLADYLTARDRRCRFPGCAKNADSCDIDHVRPHGNGGPTASRNCCCLCRRHHRMKTHGGWQLELARDGSVRWTSPHGHVFEVDPTGQLE